MARLRLYPPEGMQDYLPDERWHKRRVEAQVREQFALSGYEEIEDVAVGVLRRGIGRRGTAAGGAAV